MSAGVAAVVALLVVVALVVAGTASKTLVSANFNNGRGPLSTDNDPQVTLRFADGGYEMLLKEPSPQVARVWFSRGTVHGFRAEVTATVRQCPGSCAIGVAAWNGPSANYMLMYSPDAGGALVKEPDASTGEKESLAETSVATSEHVRFVFEVRGGGSRPTTLVGSVNGVELRASDSDGFDSFGGVGLWAAGDTGPVDILWDDLKVTRL